MFEMSYNEAIQIQRSQMAWYRSAIGLRGIRIIKARTLPCPPDIHPDEKISICTINKLVPRGGNFETLFCYGRRYKKRPSTMLDEDVRMAMCNGIRRGIL